MSARSRWDERADALWALIDEVKADHRGRALAQIVDIDALDPGRRSPAELWDDRYFSKQRRALLGQLLSAVERRTLTVRRVLPTSPRVTDALSGIGDWAEPADQIAPAVRPIRDWLHKQGHLTERDLQRILALPRRDTDAHLVAVAYDALPFDARETAKRASLLRGPQRLNGVLGPFKIDSDLPKVDVDHLVCAGFLWRGQHGSHVEMPRLVRSFLVPLAELTSPEVVKADHRRLGRQDLAAQSLENQLETHHHAVRGGEIEVAKATASHYGNDLRELAFRLSFEDRAFGAAADVYRYIIDSIDPDDAYAWEYYAYNLALASSADNEPLLGLTIRSAYERAHALEPENPLYHGRHLAFRARLGEDIHTDFAAGMSRYLSPNFPEEATTFFAEPVLKALEHSGRQSDQTRIVDRWASEMARFERLRPFCE